MIGRSEDVNIGTSFDQMLLPSDTSFEISQKVQRPESNFPQFFFCLEFKAESK
jgi:hypothetical protein